MSAVKRRLCCVTIVACLTAGFASPALPQSTRDSLLLGIEAYENFHPDEARTLQLIAAGLNPAGGETDEAWSAGLHRMVQLLMDAGRETIAQTWLRWAYRQNPELQSDPAFPRNVIQALDSARSFVTRGSQGDNFAETNWEWSRTTMNDSVGVLRVLSANVSVPITVLVVGIGVVTEGELRELPAATYELRASAPDYLPAEVSREILPGVATVVNFTLIDQNPAYLYVASEPWANVMVDDRRIGYTAIAAHPLALGTHHIRIERPGFVPFDTTITVARDERLRLGTINLERR